MCDFQCSPTQGPTTQEVALQAVVPSKKAEAEGARLVAIAGEATGRDWLLKPELSEVFVGRAPDCLVHVTDKRASGQHLKIYRDKEGRYYLEQLSANCCYLNHHVMKKGDTRALQHGDEVSLCVPVRSDVSGLPPFAAYHFQLPRQEVRTEQSVNADWDLRTVLGAGNFAEVRLGIHVKTGAKRAVKVIDKQKFLSFRAKRDSILELHSEAQMLISLKHTGIVDVMEWFETDGSLYVVMEFLEGGDLLSFIMDNGRFSEDVARRLFRELCEAVRYLHSRSIIHRDLKPENILLTERSEATHLRIADFGLSRVSPKSCDCKTFCGTPQYFAPEVITTFRDRQAGDPHGYGFQADMWSLGVILYIMLSGVPPFEDEGLYEQILDGRYEFDVPEWTTVTAEAKELVRALLRVNPKDRLTVLQTLEHPWLRLPDAQLPPPRARSRSRSRPPRRQSLGSEVAERNNPIGAAC